MTTVVDDVTEFTLVGLGVGSAGDGGVTGKTVDVGSVLAEVGVGIGVFATDVDRDPYVGTGDTSSVSAPPQELNTTERQMPTPRAAERYRLMGTNPKSIRQD